MNKKSAVTAGALAAAALTGLFAGSAHAKTVTSIPVIGNPSVNSIHSALPGHAAGDLSDHEGKHDCKGKNECKGKGNCKSGDNGCKGKNSCKGKGGCASHE